MQPPCWSTSSTPNRGVCDIFIVGTTNLVFVSVFLLGFLLMRARAESPQPTFITLSEASGEEGREVEAIRNGGEHCQREHQLGEQEEARAERSSSRSLATTEEQTLAYIEAMGRQGFTYRTRATNALGMLPDNPTTSCKLTLR
jgi:hypothetical protein